MEIKCYIVENSAECAEAVNSIEAAIPCFTHYDLRDDNSIEFTISCRVEDLPFVENKIAEFV